MEITIRAILVKIWVFKKIQMNNTMPKIKMKIIYITIKINLKYYNNNNNMEHFKI